MLHKSPRRVARLHAAGLAACLAALIGCSHGPPVAPDPLQGLAPDWSLQDVNPNSATSAQMVSPRGELGKVSAWYFGHAT